MKIERNTSEHPDVANITQFNGGYVYIQATLPEECIGKVEWDLNSMKWGIENGDLSSDGRTFNTIVKLNSTGNLDSSSQTYGLVTKVTMAENNFEFKPEIKVWLNGNETDETNTNCEVKYVKNINNVKVTAIPRYNIKLGDCLSEINIRRTVNYNGKDVTGRIYGAGLVAQLYNSTTESGENKGIKGIEIPKGDITFDIDLSVLKGTGENAQDVTSTVNPILWNYNLNGSNVGEITERTMDFGDKSYYCRWNAPYGKIGMANGSAKSINSVYDSGNVKMLQNGSKITVILSNYKFNGIFPEKYMNDGDDTTNVGKIFDSNIGCFSSTFMQIFVPEPQEQGNYTLKINEGQNTEKTTNVLKVNSTEYQQQIETDDALEIQYMFNVYGEYSHSIILFRNDSLRYLSSAYEKGDGKAIKGQEFDARFYINQSPRADTGTELKTVNKLIKFDGDGLELRDIDGKQYVANTNTMTWKMWYATKKDGTTWIDENERNNTNANDLVLYENKSDIPNNFICIGLYFESQGGILNIPQQSLTQYIKIKFKIKDTAQAGKVYSMVQDDVYWRETLDRSTYSIINKELKYPSGDNGYGDYPTGVAKFLSDQYEKTTYNATGAVVKEHTSGLKGQSVLVINANVGVKKTVNDKTSTGENKKYYNIGNNEYEVEFKLESTLTQENIDSAEPISDATIKLVDTLPSGLTYIAGTSSYDEPKIIENEDGTTILIWNIYGCTANTPIPEIIYKVHIDEKSAVNTEYINQVYAICQKAVSTSDISTVTIQVVNNATQRIYKTTNEPLIEKNGMLHYTIEYTNLSEQAVSNFRILDTLPYNGDGRNTLFNGTYTLDHIIITGQDGLEVYTTNSEDVRNINELPYNDLISNDTWHKETNIASINKTATAFAVKGTVNANKTITINLYLKTDGNKKLDRYVNSAKCYYLLGNTEMDLTSSNIKEEVINRSIQGTVWLDLNANGIMDTSETKLQGVKVELLDENENTLNTVSTNENGEYIFEELLKANYKIKISTTNYYEETEKNVGDNITINSKINSNKKTDLIEDLNKDEVQVKYQNGGLLVAKTNISVTKLWMDNSNEYRKRPESIVLKLMNGANEVTRQEVIGNTGTNEDWNYVFLNVPKYAIDGEEINYTVVESEKNTNELKLYSSKTTGNKTEGYTITNTFTIPDEKVNVVVNKVWDDNNNESGKRPQSIKLQLKDGTTVKAEYILTTADNGTHTFENLPKYNSFGDTITYTAHEVEVNEGDLEMYTVSSTTGNMLDGYVVTNKFTVPNDKISLVVTKQWMDSENLYNKRPESIILVVKNGDEIVKTQGIKLEDNWTYTFTDLAKYDAKGNEIIYTIDEQEAIPGDLLYYDKTINGTDITNTFKITNDTVESNITKEANKEEIVQKNEEIEYTIDYTATINQYIGSATITIVDKLPYEIDTTKSDLNGGTYQKTNNTITWSEVIGDINTFTTNEAKQISMQKKIKLVYTNYELTEEIGNINNQVKGTITLNTTGKTQEKTAEKEVKVNLKPGKVLINHYLKDTTQKLVDSTSLEGKIGDTYITVPNENLLKEYDLIAEPDNKEGEYKRENQVVNYYYVKKKGNLVVEYREKNTGKELINSKTTTEDVGTDYTTTKENIEYYKFIESTDNTQGKYTVEDQKVIYYYEQLPFNLSVEKLLSNVILNGAIQTNNAELAKIEISSKDVNNTDLKLIYKIIVKNTGEVAGTADLFEQIPTGFKMDKTLNSNWEIAEREAKLSVPELEPGKEETYDVILTWDNNQTEGLGTVKNIAKIANMENKPNYKDNNEADNQDYADFILSLKTGKEDLTLIIAGIIMQLVGVGSVIIIKKIR